MAHVNQGQPASDPLKLLQHPVSDERECGVRHDVRQRWLGRTLLSGWLSVMTLGAVAQFPPQYTVSPSSCSLYCEAGATTETVLTVTSIAGPSTTMGMSVFTKDDAAPQVQSVLGALDANLAVTSAFCGNYYHCTSARRLDSFETWVDVQTTTLLQAAIFHATQLEGPYKMICSYGHQTGPVSGFVSWPGVNLSPGSYYLIGAVVKSTNTVGYTSPGSFPQTLPFGEAIAGHVVQAAMSPAYEPASAMAYQRLNTSPEWLTTSAYPGISSLAGGQSTTITVQANATGLTGTHYGQVSIGSTTVPVTLVVTDPVSPPEEPQVAPQFSAQVLSIKVSCKAARCAAKLRMGLTNIQDVAAARTRCGIYLSADGTLDDSDVQIGTMSFGLIGPNSTVTRGKTLRLPQNAAGQYLICAPTAEGATGDSGKSGYTLAVPLR
jgi:hypothetical protein